LSVGLEDCGGFAVFDWDAINVVAVIVIEEEDVGIAQAGSGRELAGLVTVGFASRDSMDCNKTIVSYSGGWCFLWEASSAGGSGRSGIGAGAVLVDRMPFLV
jgi:hypothetical protein